MRRLDARIGSGATAGSVLIEVVIAILLLAVLIVPLTGAVLSGAGRADAAWSQAARVVRTAPADSVVAAWDWGPQVASVWWRPGPTLHLVAPGFGVGSGCVGLWLEGWFIGEREVGNDGSLTVDAAAWIGSAGSELVARVRLPGGCWGPPWRSLVPGSDGTVPALVGGEGPVVGPGNSEEVVTHLPGAGTADPDFSWTETVPETEPDGSPVVATATPVGACRVGVHGADQSWWMTEGRALDVYF